MGNLFWAQRLLFPASFINVKHSQTQTFIKYFSLGVAFGDMLLQILRGNRTYYIIPYLQEPLSCIHWWLDPLP